MIPGRSDYETWVLTLRDWRTNPQQDLTGLPALAEEDLSPEAFSRLVDHITEAIQAVTDAWQENLSRTTQEARTDFELARALAGSRRYLRRRVELARHPGLPEALRKVLDDGCTRDVTRMQGELEQQMQGTINLISNVADATSEIVNELIEGGLGLFQTHGTVPAEVYNTLDRKKKKKKRKIHL